MLSLASTMHWNLSNEMGIHSGGHNSCLTSARLLLGQFEAPFNVLSLV